MKRHAHHLTAVDSFPVALTMSIERNGGPAALIGDRFDLTRSNDGLLRRCSQRRAVERLSTGKE